MDNYLIEFRTTSYAKKYLKQQIYDVSKKFRVRGVTRNRPVPHISFVGPFSASAPPWPLSIFFKSNETKIINAFFSVVQKYKPAKFKLKGFGHFREDVIYADIESSNEMSELQKELAEKILPLVESTSSNLQGEFHPHATIAFKDINHKFNNIWHYLHKQSHPNINQHLLRLTLLKNARILYEYDFLQKRLLNRYEARNKEIWRKTVHLLKAYNSKYCIELFD